MKTDRHVVRAADSVIAVVSSASRHDFDDSYTYTLSHKTSNWPPGMQAFKQKTPPPSCDGRPISPRTAGTWAMSIPLIYFAENFLTALHQANIAGLSEDLYTNVGNRYNVLAMIFFVGYCLIDIPTAFTVRKIGPALLLGVVGTVWGIVTIGQVFFAASSLDAGTNVHVGKDSSIVGALSQFVVLFSDCSKGH